MSVEIIVFPGKKIFLVGTAHVSKKSVEEVKEVIKKERPDSVGIELDFQRYKQLKENRKWQETNIVEVVKSGKTFLLLFNILLSNIQQRFGELLGVKPGTEMRVAGETAIDHNAKLYFLDRDIRITFKRAIARMGLLEKIKLFFYIIAGFFAEKEELTPKKIEEMKKQDTISKLVNELSKNFPSIKQVLIDERDQYIAGKIMQMQGKKIVAIVGAGHVKGIKENLSKKNDLEKLEFVPQKKSIFSYVKYLVPVIFVFVLLYLFTKQPEQAYNAIIAWVLLHALLSSLGVLIAGGKWQSILSAFIASPFTSLHPAIAAGWIAAVVEASVSSPKVIDFEKLNSLYSINSFRKNRVTRVLLVAAMANLGSMLATILFGTYLVSML